MQGSVFKGYGGSDKPAPEHNVASDIAAAKIVLSAPWRSIAITPLDTCGLPDVTIAGQRMKRLKQSHDPLIRAVLESSVVWAKLPDLDHLTASSLLYDTVAVYLADPNGSPLLVKQKLKIAVTDDGKTVVSPDGHEMSVATSWTDLEKFRDHLCNVLSR
jgi:inosine-uridine nucleoside N-ribohydrolase